MYGAASSSGDIVFTSNDTTPGSFRISFKTGADVINIANAPSVASSVSVKAADQYVCVQVTAADLPKGTPKEITNMMQRTQCINVSQLQHPANITLQIEENMTVFESTTAADAAHFVTIGQSTTEWSSSQGNAMVGIYYPSISQIIPMNDLVTFPVLTLPSSLASNPVLTSWINFINLVMGAMETNYGTLFLPSYIASIIAAQKPIFILKKDDESAIANFGDLSKIYTTKNVQYAFSGLPGTIFAGDIPSLDMFKSYLTSNLLGTKQSITLTNLLTALKRQALVKIKSALTELWISLVFSTTPNTYSELLLPAPELVQLNAALTQNLIVNVSSYLTRTSTGQNLTMTVSLPVVNEPIFSYTFTNILNIQKTPVPPAAKLFDVNFSYQKKDMSAAKVLGTNNGSFSIGRS